MAITRSETALTVVLDAGRTFIHHKRDAVLDALARRRVYRRTLNELSMLSDRDIRDLGIPRSNIKRLAQEAAYGC